MSGTRLFFAACLLIAAVLFIAQAASPAPTQAMPPEAVSGMKLWQAKNCEGCHTLYGQGGAYAPDLTGIYEQRGADYLREFLLSPASFHPNQRVMPAFGLTESEMTSMIAFLQWVGEQEAAKNWPPQIIQIRGGGNLESGASSDATDNAPAEVSNDPLERGAALFKSPPAICSTCHALQPDVVIVGPSLAGIASRAGSRVPGLSAEAYIRNSILHPSDFVVPGFPDAMQKNFGTVLRADQINDLIAFLLTQN